MNVALCGATGRAGSRIMNELLTRGHTVLAIVRQEGFVPPHSDVRGAVDDLSDTRKTAETIRGTGALVSAYAPPPENTEELVAVTRRLVEATALSGVPRFVMVGGAGSLEVAPGVTLEQSGKLPPAWLPIASAHTHALEFLRSCSASWTYLSPGIYFEPGTRTGQFRLGADNLIFDDKGNSAISMEDYAVAIVDELEAPKHLRQRFSIGY